MKIPFVKEWGSWAVFFSSCCTGLITGLHTRPWMTGREFAAVTVLSILGFTLLINSKNPLTAAIRSKWERATVQWFLFFCITGIALLIPFLAEGFTTFSIFAVLIASYCVLLYMGKEHHILSELNGFSLLTISAPAVYFAVTGEMSWKLYVAVTVFFSGGVFKIRLRLKKTLLYRWIMILYCVAASIVFYLINIPVILLLPFLENMLTAVWLREEKLRTTGYTELVKSILFILLVWKYWQ